MSDVIKFAAEAAPTLQLWIDHLFNLQGSNIMSDEKPESWPLLPSHSSYTLHGITIALADVIHEEVSNDVSRRSLLKANSLATAAELFANELAHFFGSRMGDDHNALEALQDHYLDEEVTSSELKVKGGRQEQPLTRSVQFLVDSDG